MSVGGDFYFYTYRLDWVGFYVFSCVFSFSFPSCILFLFFSYILIHSIDHGIYHTSSASSI